MDQPQSELQSFIIKVWLESGDDRDKVVWSGHITHVPSGERRYLKRLSSIQHFIEPYLVKMGVKPSLGFRFAQWSKRRTAKR
jgi:hypothetical protein